MFGACSTSSAGLIIDLRATGRNGGPIGSGDTPHSVRFVRLGETISFDVYAIVVGTNATTSDDRLVSASGSFRSDATGVSGGVFKANLLADVVRSVTNPDTGEVITPGFDKNGFSVGLQQDLDADGDLDVGSNDVSSANDYWGARYNDTTNSGALAGTPDGVRIGSGTISVFLTPPDHIPRQDHIRFYGRDSMFASTYVQDGQIISEATRDSLLVNSITIHNTPEPALIGPIALVSIAMTRRQRRTSADRDQD
jgi:hypothetical protein